MPKKPPTPARPSTKRANSAKTSSRVFFFVGRTRSRSYWSRSSVSCSVSSSKSRSGSGGGTAPGATSSSSGDQVISLGALRGVNLPPSFHGKSESAGGLTPSVHAGSRDLVGGGGEVAGRGGAADSTTRRGGAGAQTFPP